MSINLKQEVMQQEEYLHLLKIKQQLDLQLLLI